MLPDAFDFETLLRTLAQYEVSFIVVGGLCTVSATNPETAEPDE
jgi:hypothetical protein